jgi:hypothetical protein
MKKYLLLSLLLLTACGDNKPIITNTICPDGSKCVAVDCTNVYLSHTDCVVAFGKSCPNGYNILETKDGNYLIQCHQKW